VSPLRLDDSLAQRVAGDWHAILELQLVEEVADVELDRVLAEVQTLGELSVRCHAFDHEREHLVLARSRFASSSDAVRTTTFISGFAPVSST